MSNGTVQIFKATYSNVPVYEMPCKGVAVWVGLLDASHKLTYRPQVMRRRSDSWLNATQILKVSFRLPIETSLSIYIGRWL